MDDVLRGARDDVLSEIGEPIGDAIGKGLVCIGALVVLGIIVMVFFLFLVVKRKTNDSSEEESSISPDDAPGPNQLKMDPDYPGADNDSSGAATRSISSATSIAGISKKLVLFSGLGYFLACCMPYGDWDVFGGFLALSVGFILFPVWIANPLYLFALVLSAKGHYRVALPFSAIATIIAFASRWICPELIENHNSTAKVWAWSMALLVVSNIRGAD